MAEPVDEVGRFQHALEDGRIQCDLCPRACGLHDGQRAFCFVRERRGDDIYLTSYGRASGFCVDPIEKKPLFHFYPGSSVLSFGTAGCNLGCKFCLTDVPRTPPETCLRAQASAGSRPPLSLCRQHPRWRCGAHRLSELRRAPRRARLV